MNYNSFLTRDYKFLGQPPSPKKRPPFTRLHAVIVVALIMFVATLVSFFSNDVEATRVSEPTPLIQLNEQALSQIHASLTLESTKEVALPSILEKDTVNQAHSNTPAPSLKQTIIKIKSGHSLSAIFKKHKFSHQDLYNIMQKGSAI